MRRWFKRQRRKRIHVCPALKDSLDRYMRNPLRNDGMGDLSFQNNVPDPLLAGDKLPNFKFELEKSKGKVLGNSFGKEATVEQLPISKGIAGVSRE
jgi:hypothetical protein